MIDLGWIIGNIVGGLVILAALGFFIWTCVHKFGYMDGSKTAWVIGSFTVFLILIGVNLWWNFPFDMAYHSFQTVSGTVEAVDSRLLASNTKGGGSDQKFAVKLAENNKIYGCLDTRCSVLKKGDHISLKCERTWQYASVPGYDCRYDQ